MNNQIQTVKMWLSFLRWRLIILIAIVMTVNSGCAVSSRDLNEKSYKVCTVTDSMIQRNGSPGVQFVNKCKDCVTVAFEYQDYEKNSKWTACNVPSHSRVVFRQAHEYWPVTQKSCIEAKKHGLGGIAAAEIEQNDQTGRCDTVGVVDD